MNKSLIPLCVFFLVIVSITALHSSGVDSLSHQSAEFYVGLSRNAATDSADIINYNPAGTAFMEDGLYLNGSLQSILSVYEHSYGRTRYRDREPVFMPAVYLLYKKERWAGFFSFTVPGGSGTVRYSNGLGHIRNQMELLALQVNALAGGVTSLPIVSQSFRASNAIFGLTLGGACRLGDAVSLSLKARYFAANREARVRYESYLPYDLAVDPGLLLMGSAVDYRGSGHGIGGGVGIDVRPVKGLTLALTAHAPAYIKYGYASYRNNAFCVDTRSGVGSLSGEGVRAPVMLLLWSKGESERKSTEYLMPPILLAGAEYAITEKYTVSTSWAVYFNRAAMWRGMEREFSTGWEGTLGFLAGVAPAVRLGIGIAYSSTGIRPGALERTSQAACPALDHWSVGGGVRYRATERLELTLGASCSIYVPEKGTYGMITYGRMGYGLALGGQYKLI